MLQIQSMKPHKPHPISRKIDADISGIVLGPENVRTSEISKETVFARALSKQTEPSPRLPGNRVGPFGWITLNFVAVCGLIAVFCTLLIRDSFEYSRRQAHLPPDAADLRPEFHSTILQGFSLEPSRLPAGLQLNHGQVRLPEDRQDRTFAVPRQVRTAQPLTSLPNNNTGLADRTSSSSKSVSSDTAAPASVSRATSSTSGSSSSGESSSSGRSTTGRAIRTSRASTISTRKAISSHRKSIYHAGTARSDLRSARQNPNGTAIGNWHAQTGLAQAKVATPGSVMSMHALGAGSAVRQIHGATNPMRMEGGLLAQPGIGAGLGGATCNGLGGGGGGNRGGNRVAK